VAAGLSYNTIGAGTSEKRPTPDLPHPCASPVARHPRPAAPVFLDSDEDAASWREVGIGGALDDPAVEIDVAAARVAPHEATTRALS